LIQQVDSKGSTRSRIGQDIRFQHSLYYTAVKFPTENYIPDINIRLLGYLTAVGNTTAGINNTNDFLVSNIRTPEGLVGDVVVRGCLGLSDHEMIEFLV